MSYTTPQTTGPAAQGYANEHDPVQPQLQAAHGAPPQYGSAAGEYNNDKAQYAPQAPPPGVHQDPNQNQHPDPAQQPQPQMQQGQKPTQYQSATPLGSLQQGAAPVDCPVCGVRELTRTEFVSGGTTHLSALLLCCCLCLGCIPYLATWFKDVEHKCGHCGALLAVWHRSGRTEVMQHGTVAPRP